MNNKAIIVGIVAVVVIGGTVLITTKNNNRSPITDNGVYCLSEGTFTDTMPIQSHRSYCVKSDASGKTYSANTPTEYSFSIIDDQGNSLKNFEITHTKPMHVIVVRKDLKYFQHVHPEFNQSTGIFTLKDLTFPADGQYRIFADFAVESGQKDSSGMPLAITVPLDVTVGTGYTREAIGSEEKTKTFDDYDVTLATQNIPTGGAENILTFNISQNGKPVTDLEQYLGSLGHSVILREGTLDFIHAHPLETNVQNGTVSFMVYFPEAGKYKVFTQFQRSGKVFLTDFVVSFAQGDSNDFMQGVDHSIH